MLLPLRRASSTSLSYECRGGGPESTSVLTLDGFKVWDPTIYELLPYNVVTKLPSLELSIVVERPTMIVGGLGPYTQVHFLL